MNYELVHAAATAIATETGRADHRVGVVLGSGLSDFARSLPGAIEIPYATIPGFPEPKVEGHGGSLFSAEFEGINVLLFAGRVHTYEGWDMDDVVFGVRAASLAGCRTVLVKTGYGATELAENYNDFDFLAEDLYCAVEKILSLHAA